MSSTVSPQQPVLTDSQVDALCAQSADRLEALRASLRAQGSALVAFSGGVDSALVLKLAVQELGERAVALTAISASVAPDEAEEARALARQLGARHVLVDSKELEDPRYAANPSNRCYFCKTELYAITSKHRADLGLAVVLDGFNADDKKDHRPGHKAAAEHGVRSPLAEAQLTKLEVRAWSHRLGLPTWDKPQMACLASRLPYGTQVTVERLRQIGAAEKAVRNLGFVNFRVRYHQEVARLELGADELARMLDATTREAVNAAIKAQGFTFVALDLEPFRTGRLNDLLKPAAGVALPVLG
jgi:pyridinium-3,5-biscarboxylic acid mononucleotide sulfurtransferase